MRYIYVLIALLAFSTSVASAQEIEHGKNYDRELIATNPDGSQVFKWTSQPERIPVIEDGKTVWKDYRLWQDDSKIYFQSATLDYIFNKNTCTFETYDAGKIGTAQKLVLSHVLKEAVMGSDTWYDSEQNSAQCDYTLTENGRQVKIESKKGDFAVIYDIDYATGFEWTYKYTNTNPLKANHKYGFTFVCDGDQCDDVKVNDSVLADVMLKNELVGTDEQILLGDLHFDPKNDVHDYLWAIKKQNNKFIADFTDAKQKLAVNQTLVVDPTITLGSTHYRVVTSSATGSSCPSPSTKDNTINPTLKLGASGASDTCMVFAPEFDTTSIPDSSGITETKLITDLYNNPTKNCDVRPITNKPSSATASTLWTDVLDGTPYVSNSNFCINPTATISVGTDPDGVAYDSANGRMYVANYGSNNVSVIRTSDNTVIATISVGTNPIGVAYDSANGRMYVANNGSNTVSVIRTSDNTVIATISVGTGPYGVAYDSANGRMYVANYGSDNVSVIRTSDNITLGSSANSDLQSKLTANWFAVGVSFTDMTRTSSSLSASLMSNARLQVTYVSGVNPPSGFTAESQTRKVQFNWSASPPVSGENSNFVTTYFIGRSLNNSTWTNKTSTGNVTSYLDTSYWRINQLYYVNITASIGTLNSTSVYTSFTTDTYPSAPQNTSTTGTSTSSIKINWSPPASDGNDPVTGYRIEYCLTCTSWSLLVNKTNTLNYNHTGLSQGDTVKYRMAAWNGVGLGAFTANFTGQTFQNTVITIPMNTTMIGDTFIVTPKAKMTSGYPPATITSSKLYKNGTLIDTDTYSLQISQGQTKTLSNQFSNLLNQNYLYNHTIQITITNGTGQTMTFSNYTIERPDYTANYKTSETGITYNYTQFRQDSNKKLNLTVNFQNPTFNLQCRVKTQLFEEGTWYNVSNVPAVTELLDVPTTQNAYVKCFTNPFVFEFSSPGQYNGTLAVLDFSEELGTFFGVPVPFFFIIFLAGIFTGVRAPIGAIFLVGTIGLMGVMGLFPDGNGNNLITGAVWALLVGLGIFGLFIGKRYS